jgi:hypothetical protein
MGSRCSWSGKDHCRGRMKCEERPAVKAPSVRKETTSESGGWMGDNAGHPV